MGYTGIKLENCSDITIDKVTGIGLDEVISAKNTKNLSATNIYAIGGQIDFDNLIKEFNLLIKETPFDNDGSIRTDAIDVAIEVKKLNRDKNKISLFRDKIKSIYKYIEKGTSFASVLLTIETVLEKIIFS